MLAMLCKLVFVIIRCFRTCFMTDPSHRGEVGNMKQSAERRLAGGGECEKEEE